jgi:hypothetical protein
MVNIILYYNICTDMQIIKTTMIAVLAVIAMIGLLNQTASATSDDEEEKPLFKVTVVLTGVDSQTGPLRIQLNYDDDSQSEMLVDPFKEGKAGTVTLDIQSKIRYRH